jgi:hypothetical protein
MHGAGQGLCPGRATACTSWRDSRGEVREARGEVRDEREYEARVREALCGEREYARHEYARLVRRARVRETRGG